MDPIDVGGCGLIYRRCVGLVANDATRWRQTVSSLWNSVDRFIRRPLAVLRACWRQVNIPDAPDMVGTVLHWVPRSLYQRLREHRLALGGMVLTMARRLALRLSGRARTCFTVSISQPRITFCVLQAASTLRSFLRNIGSSRAISSLLLGQKSLLMARKKCRVISRLSVGPPCVISM